MTKNGFCRISERRPADQVDCRARTQDESTCSTSKGCAFLSTWSWSVFAGKSRANKAAIDAINAGRDVPILLRQVKYLNNIVEQDHRAIKRVTRPMLNFKSFRAAGSVLAGVELVHMIRKGQFTIDGADTMSFSDQFYALAGNVRPV